ncbi:MAG: ABC transporter permease [Anaerolineales bacterium]|nr:ABC transporter permease [Anaerolineales bacterium]MCB9432465.1 ABC transporter permease [Ardenticatenaceae bacterium]
MTTTSAPAKPRFSLVSILATPTVGPFIALVLASILFASQSDRFLSASNFSLIVQQVMVVGTLAIGQTLVILTAGIDLSNGMIMAFSQILMAKVFMDNAVPAPLAILLGFIAAMAFGAANGLLVTRLKLPPFIVTLGMFNIAFALTRIYTTTTIRMTDSPWHVFFGRTFTVGGDGGTKFTYGSVLMVLLFFIAWFVLRETAIGRRVYAIGDNPEATRLAGINTQRLLVGVYMVAGLFYGIAGLLLISRTGVADPQAGQNANLESITAVVLGGTSLFGGRGNILGTLLGALIVGIFRNGLTLMGVDSIYQWLITGVLVILAVAVDQVTQRRAK